MDIGYAVFKGIVQGLAEFLPISSTAHLVFFDTLSRMFGWSTVHPSHAEEEFFDILLHLGTMAAVIYYFRVELGKIWCHVMHQYFKQPLPEDLKNPPEYEQLPLSELFKLLAISTFMTCVVIGLFLKGSEFIFARNGMAEQGITDISEFYFHHPIYVAVHLMFTGFLLFFTQKMSDKYLSGTFGTGQIVQTRHATAIGLFQGFAAIFHGISRSGSTISAGLATGLDRVTATKYSFLLSLPTFILATGYEFYKFNKSGHIDNFQWLPLIIGTLVAAIVGYFCVKFFIKFLAKNRLTPFAFYCWGMGTAMLILLASTGQV